MDKELHQIKNTLRTISDNHMEKVDLFPVSNCISLQLKSQDFLYIILN